MKTNKVYPRFFYRDPLISLIERESGTCKGCIHAKQVFDKKICAHEGRTWGRKCNMYDDGTPASKRGK